MGNMLIDFMISQENAFAALKHFSKYEWNKRILVLAILGEGPVIIEKTLLENGITDCIKKPFDGTLIKIKIRNIIKLFQFQNSLE